MACLICAFSLYYLFRPQIMKLEMGKQSGSVKFFDVTKGFGFITPADGSKDLFVHQTNIYARGFRSLREGEPVEYEIQEDPVKGKEFAINVTGPNGQYVQGNEQLLQFLSFFP
jgi:cold shock CspA family protein